MKLNITALVIDCIVDRIARGNDIPSERYMTEEIGVSRLVVRNALLLLWYDGAIDISHGKRTKVVRPPTDEFMARIEEMYNE